MLPFTFVMLPAILVPFIFFGSQELKYLVVTSMGGTATFLFLWVSKFQFRIIEIPGATNVISTPISLLILFGAIITSFGIIYLTMKNYEQLLITRITNENAISFYANAMESTSLVAFTDPTGKTTYASDRFCKYSGFTRGELIGRTHSVISSGNHSRQFFQHLWNTILKGNIWTGEICNKTKDGKLWWAQTTIVPMTDGNGKVVQFMAIRHDITEKNSQNKCQYNHLA